jgi:glycerate dehydrogenase
MSDASPQQREILVRTLGPAARLSYAHDLGDSERGTSLEGADVVLSGGFRREIDQANYHRLSNVRLIQLLSAGANHLPMADLPPGPIIASNAGAYATPMAEHVLALILALAKNIVLQDRKLHDGEFDQGFPGRSIAGSTAGIIGFGGIGRAVARLLRPFEVRVLGINQSGRTEDEIATIGSPDQLEGVLRESDIIVLSVPLTKTTRGSIGWEQLTWMKTDAILVNVARGGLVDEAALYEHAQTHPDFRLGLDVWWDEPFADGHFRTQYPLLELPNVIGSPHNSGNVPGIWDEAIERAAENVAGFLRGEQVSGVIRREDYI